VAEQKIYTAKTVEVAVAKAARELGVPMGDVKYEVVSDGKGGLFGGISKRDVEIRVDAEASRTAAAAAPPEAGEKLTGDHQGSGAAEGGGERPPRRDRRYEKPRESFGDAPRSGGAHAAGEGGGGGVSGDRPAGDGPRGPRGFDRANGRREQGRGGGRAEGRGESRGTGRGGYGQSRHEGRRPFDGGKPADTGPERPPLIFADDTPDTAALEGSVAAVRRLIQALGIELTVEGRTDDDQIVISLSGPDEALFEAEDEDEPAESLQFLLNVMMRRAPWRPAPRIQIVAAGAATRRERAIEEEAKRAAESVRATGAPVELPPMNSWERRIAHMALRDEPGVKTFSVGEGRDRRLTVAPQG